MTTDLEKELQESIKKNLPQQVGDVLKERLTQADRDAATVRDQAVKLVEQTKEIEILETAIIEYRKLDERNATLESREEKVKEGEKKLEIEKLTYQLQAEKDKTLFSQNVALGLVRNTSYRKTIFDTENPGGTPTFDQYNNAHYPMPTSKAYDETKTEE